jgi:hypothetical protein
VLTPSTSPSLPPDPDAAGVPKSVLEQSVQTNALIASGQSIVDGASVTPMPKTVGVELPCQHHRCGLLTAVEHAKGGYVLLVNDDWGSLYCDELDREVTYLRTDGSRHALGTSYGPVTTSAGGGLVAFQEYGAPFHVIVKDLSGSTLHRHRVNRTVNPLALDDQGLWYFAYDQTCPIGRKLRPEVVSYWDFSTGLNTRLSTDWGKVIGARADEIIFLRRIAGTTKATAASYETIAVDVSDPEFPRELWRGSYADIAHIDPTGTSVALVSQLTTTLVDATTGQVKASFTYPKSVVDYATWNATGDVLNYRYGPENKRLSVTFTTDADGLVTATKRWWSAKGGPVIFGEEPTTIPAATS